jgi:hypothetical protein
MICSRTFLVVSNILNRLKLTIYTCSCVYIYIYRTNHVHRCKMGFVFFQAHSTYTNVYIYIYVGYHCPNFRVFRRRNCDSPAAIVQERNFSKRIPSSNFKCHVYTNSIERYFMYALCSRQFRSVSLHIV